MKCVTGTAKPWLGLAVEAVPWSKAGKEGRGQSPARRTLREPVQAPLVLVYGIAQAFEDVPAILRGPAWHEERAVRALT
jgi:hypothetical protein